MQRRILVFIKPIMLINIQKLSIINEGRFHSLKREIIIKNEPNKFKIENFEFVEEILLICNKKYVDINITTPIIPKIL